MPPGRLSSPNATSRRAGLRRRARPRGDEGRRPGSASIDRRWRRRRMLDARRPIVSAKPGTGLYASKLGKVLKTKTRLMAMNASATDDAAAKMRRRQASQIVTAPVTTQHPRQPAHLRSRTRRPQSRLDRERDAEDEQRRSDSNRRPRDGGGIGPRCCRGHDPGGQSGNRRHYGKMYDPVSPPRARRSRR